MYTWVRNPFQVEIQCWGSILFCALSFLEGSCGSNGSLTLCCSLRVLPNHPRLERRRSGRIPGSSRRCWSTSRWADCSAPSATWDRWIAPRWNQPRSFSALLMMAHFQSLLRHLVLTLYNTSLKKSNLNLLISSATFCSLLLVLLIRTTFNPEAAAYYAYN